MYAQRKAKKGLCMSRIDFKKSCYLIGLILNSREIVKTKISGNSVLLELEVYKFISMFYKVLHRDNTVLSLIF